MNVFGNVNENKKLIIYIYIYVINGGYLVLGGHEILVAYGMVPHIGCMLLVCSR